MTSLRVVGLFAGIGGIEKGLEASGHASTLLCEIDPAARAVLDRHFESEVENDVRALRSLPEADLLAAGFPCQDLSQAGGKAGIRGSQSSLVSEVFRLVRKRATRPEYLLFENVSYMLRLDKGQAMDFLVSRLESFGYRWAYRVVDARAFGVPQRRQRVVLLASLNEDPGRVLFADDAPTATFDDTTTNVDRDAVYGFYWTEGLRGLGWTRNAVPTIKGGSALGIPSPPAVWDPTTGEIGTPEIEDAERLQGFAADWTAAAEQASFKRGARWRLVGNAVCVDMAEWIGSRLSAPGDPAGDVRPLRDGARWPSAAQGRRGERSAVQVSMYPRADPIDLKKFLSMPLKPLSTRAAAGFYSRAGRSTTLNFPSEFLDDIAFIAGA
ncbi:DNA cytosine methyltransferase [Egicoccus sp. AB-alg2]|uniref:DNA cytosine methyltransferase n=1 Tax=Egicoccus sp. AB-alg2 TaxID=3242693 RepID=UPI00359CC670